jgi:two-component system sensor histidine kinase KdpD
MLYLLVVAISAFRWGLRPAIMTAIVGVIAFDFFFVSPIISFRMSDTEYLITFAGLIFVGALISFLVARAREHAEAAQIRERETSTLYALSQDLALAVDKDSVMSAVARNIRDIFGWDSTFLLQDEGRMVEYPAGSDLRLDAKEMAVADWSFRHGLIAGYDTDTLHDSRLRYLPLMSSRGVSGILGVRPREPDGIITPEQARILNAFANQAAIALERVSLAKGEAHDQRPGTGPAGP